MNKMKKWGAVTYHLMNNSLFRIKNSLKNNYNSSGEVLSQGIDVALKRTHNILSRIACRELKKKLIGANILEIGPGDNLGLAVSLIGMGAKKVTCLDKFTPKRNSKWEKLFYERLLENMPPNERRRAKEAIILKEKVSFRKRKIRYLQGKGIEEFTEGQYDIIISHSVLEHVQNLEKTFENMDRLLSRGGLMVHSVDLRDHKMFTTLNLHPLTFLTFSDGLWEAMRSHSGRPNRKGIQTYRRLLSQQKYLYTIRILRVLDRELKPPQQTLKKGRDYDKGEEAIIEEIRPYLKEEFKKYSTAELLSSEILIVARKV